MPRGNFIQTKRLILRRWADDHYPAFARMHADPEVMADLGGPIDRTTSDAKLDRYRALQEKHGYSRWAVHDADDVFVGYAGVVPRLDPHHPLGRHDDLGWRFTRAAWGRGYATESAAAALTDAFERCGLKETFAYTSPDNARSQAVMARLNLRRDPSRDFVADYGKGPWRGLVWVALLPGK